MPRGVCFLGLLLASAVVGCGDCPPSRRTPARPASDETIVFAIDASGAVTRDSAPVACDAGCRAVVSSFDTKCETACASLRVDGKLTSCAFEGGRAKLTCHVHHDATDERCSCDVLDC